MTNAINKKIRKQLMIMLAIVVGMFGFCYALVPIYNVFCQVTGLNGKTSNEAQKNLFKVDKSRTVTIELLATLNESLTVGSGEFTAKTKKYTLHPGETITTSYWVKNLTHEPKVVQAIPSVTPGLAARHIKKIECFCFQKQPLNAQEGKEMPLVFTIDPALPTNVKTITLAYTLFDVTKQ